MGRSSSKGRVCRVEGCPLCEETRCGGRYAYRGHYGYMYPTPSAPQEEWIVEYLRRSHVAGKGSAPTGTADVADLVGLCPALTEFLTAAEWEPGVKREVGTVMVFAEGQTWKAWLHDRDAKSSCFVTARALLGLLGAIEETLANGGGDWRSDLSRTRPNR